MAKLGRMTSFLLPLLMLVVECYCAPYIYGTGGSVGGASQLDLSFGGRTDITRDGLAFTADSKNLLGAKWQGTGQAGGYAQLGEKFLGAAGSVGGTLGGALTPGGRFALGLDSKGRIPIEFNPSLGISKEARAAFGGNIYTGDDARLLAGSYGAFGALNDPKYNQKGAVGAVY